LIYSVDQYGIYRQHTDAMMLIKIVPALDNDLDYQAMQTWRKNNELVQIVAEPPKPSLAEYKLMAKQGIAAKADAFVDRLTTAAGIPKVKWPTLKPRLRRHSNTSLRARPSLHTQRSIKRPL
jgi:hypothetical protein